MEKLLVQAWFLVSSVLALLNLLAAATTLLGDLQEFWETYMIGLSTPVLISLAASSLALAYVYYPAWKKLQKTKELIVTSDKKDIPPLVQNIAQHGSGVAAGFYINQAPKPEVSINRETEWVQAKGGKFSKTYYVSVVAPGDIPGVKVSALGRGIEDLDAWSRTGGVMMLGHSGQRDWGCFLTVQSVANWSSIEVIASEPTDLEIKLEILG